MKVLVKSQGRWEDNIKVGLKEIGWGVVHSIKLTQNMDLWQALVNMVIKHQTP